MPKRRSCGPRGGPTVNRRRQHLYLIFDDWDWGYSIRKLDLSSVTDSDEDTVEPPHGVSGDIAQPHLSSAVFRLEAPRGLPHYFASAFGTRIMAMHPREPGTDGRHYYMPEDIVPVFDVRTQGVIFGPRPNPEHVDPIYIPVGDRLFALAVDSFEQLWPPPLEYADGDRWVWSWYQLPKPPFKRRHVTSYAIHPDGRTIFVSTQSRSKAATFTFDTEAENFEWKKYCKWSLPFDGRAHFEPELDAWVGLSKDPDTLGRLSSCDILPISPKASDLQYPALAQKLSKEKLFSKEPSHVGVNLIYMGRSGFCLVQCIYKNDDVEVEEKDVPRPCRHLFRLTTFSLRYDKNGDLTTGKSRSVQYCEVPEACTEFLLSNPVAFWL